MARAGSYRAPGTHARLEGATATSHQGGSAMEGQLMGGAAPPTDLAAGRGTTATLDRILTTG